MFVILILLHKFYLRSKDLDITANKGCATFIGTFACPYLFMSLPVTVMQPSLSLCAWARIVNINRQPLAHWCCARLAGEEEVADTSDENWTPRPTKLSNVQCSLKCPWLHTKHSSFLHQYNTKFEIWDLFNECKEWKRRHSPNTFLLAASCLLLHSMASGSELLQFWTSDKAKQRMSHEQDFVPGSLMFHWGQNFSALWGFHFNPHPHLCWN